MPSKEKTEEKAEEKTEEKAEEKTKEETTNVILAEDKEQPGQKPEPKPEPAPVAEKEPKPEPLSEADVQEVLDSTNLPDPAKAWLVESEYVDKGALAKAVEKAVERVKAMTGSGNVVGMGESGPASSENKPFTEEEKRDQFIQTLEDCGVPTTTLRETK